MINLGWLGTPAAAALLPIGPCVPVLALLFAGLIIYVYRRESVLARRLDVMSDIAGVAAGARDHSAVMLAAMEGLCRLHGANFAWFQMVEADDLVLKDHVGLPEWITGPRRRIPVRASVIIPLLDAGEARRVSVRSLPADLRKDLERAGMRYLLLVPVMGETALIGILAFGLTRRRWSTAEHLPFLTTIGKQLGVAGEKLRLFQQVLQSQRQWLATIDSIHDSILVHDAQARVLRMNRALAHRLGRELPELIGQPLASVLPGAQLGCPYCELAQRTSGEVPDPCFGGYSLISTSSYYLGDHGHPDGTVHVIRDSTERRIREERYRLLFESVQEGVFVSTPEGRLVDCNRAFASMLGYAGREDMLDLDIARELFLSPQQRAAYSAEMSRLGSMRNYEVMLTRKDGQIVTLLENSFATRNAHGEIERIQGFLVDITEKKRVEQEMRRRNKELSALNAMATTPAATFNLDQILRNTLHWTSELFAQQCNILLFDPESGCVTRSQCNRENREEESAELGTLLEGKLATYIARAQAEIVTEQDLPRLPEPARSWVIKRGYQSFVAVIMYSRRKTLGLLLISSQTPNQFTANDHNFAIAIARQLGSSLEKVLLYEEMAKAYENLRSTQEQLLQSEKMSAVGQLISGVAHELNNPLTAILGYVQLLETEPLQLRAQDYVRKLYQQTQRTHRIVQNLLSFSRQRKPIHSKVDLRRPLDDSLALREFDLKLNNVTVEREYDSALPFITGDAHQLEQVFLNIINNAVDAIMDCAQSGSLRVRTFLEDGRACVEFRDSGVGLKDPKKIYDPFYTTKKIGKGTGLGLSICYGIVKEHGGDIIAFNHEQGGAVFKVKLPIESGQLSSGAAALSRHPSIPGG